MSILYTDYSYPTHNVQRIYKLYSIFFFLFLENVSLMLESCKYEKAWYIQSRPAWCAVFTQYDLEVRII